MIPLRPYQLQAVDNARRLIRAGKQRIVVVAPTGSGKTVLAAHIMSSAASLGRRVLFVAHRRELIKQTFDKLVADGIAPDQIGVIMAGVKFARSGAATVGTSWDSAARWRPSAPIQVASIDTLRGRQKPAADLVFIDECHRAMAASYMALFELYPNSVHIGLTATPWRSDGRGLGRVYQDIVSVASIRSLIGAGFLVEPRVFTVPAEDLPDLASVKISRGDYDEKQLSAAVDREGLVGNIVEHWQTHSGGARTVVFATGVDHSKHIRDRFVAAGVRAEHLDGSTPTADRDAILGRLDRGETTVVCNCDVLSEGWDMPSVAVCVLAKPTRSVVKYLQKVGRILRPFPGKNAIILDHAGCALDLGLPQEDREFSLEDQPKKSKTSAGPSAKTCPGCFAVLSVSVRTCPECGHDFSGDIEADDKTKERDGSLVEVRPATIAEKRAFWFQLCHVAKERGFKIGWAKYKYKDRFKTWPPSSFGVPEQPKQQATEAERNEELRRLLATAKDRGYHHAWVSHRMAARFG